MSKKWVDVDKISSIAGRSKKYTDDKIADLAGTTLDAISDLEDGKQDTIFGSEGRDLVFNRDGELVAPPMRPNDNLIPYTNFANPDDFYANWTRSNTNITIEENEYVSFAADGEISIVLSKDVVKVLRNTGCIFSIVGTGTIDAVVSCNNTKTNGQTVLTPYIHIYDLEVPNPKTELVYSTGSIHTDLAGEVTSLTVEISAEAGARLYGVKLELGQIQTLAVDNLSGGYDIIPQYPARVLSTDYNDRYIAIPKIAEDSVAGKGINNVVTYDKEGNTQFQHITPNKNWLKDSIFCEMPSETEWPLSWTRDPETIHFGSSYAVTGHNLYVSFANTSGTIATTIPLSELPIVANVITISAFGDGEFSLSAKLIQNGSDDLISIEDTYGNLNEVVTSPKVPSNKAKPAIVSLTGHININNLDLSQYSLYISINGYDGGSEYTSAALYGVKLEAGYHQTLAFLRQATPTYSVMTVIPQFPEDTLTFDFIESSTNLIKNSYFSKTRALNTQGKTTYTISNNDYTEIINNWFIYAPSGGVSKFELYSYYSKITAQTSNIYAYFFTLINAHMLVESSGSSPYTISWYCYNAESDYYVVLRTLNNNVYVGDYTIIYTGSDTGHIVKTIYFPPTVNINSIEIGFATSSFVTLVFAELRLGFRQNSYDVKNNLNLEYVDSYDLGLITIPQEQRMTVGYNSDGRLCPVIRTPRKNLLKNANFTHVSKVLINGEYSSTPKTIYPFDLNIREEIFNWYLYSPGETGSATVGVDSISFTSGNNRLFFSQNITYISVPEFKTSAMTYSVVYVENGKHKIFTITMKFENIPESSTYHTMVYGINDSLIFVIGYNNTQMYAQIGTEPNKNSKVVAMKIEIGNDSTIGYIQDGKVVLLDPYEPIAISYNNLSTLSSWRIDLTSTKIGDLNYSVCTTLGIGFTIVTSTSFIAVVTMINVPDVPDKVINNCKAYKIQISKGYIMAKYSGATSSLLFYDGIPIAQATKNSLTVYVEGSSTSETQYKANTPVILSANGLTTDSDPHIYIMPI